MTITAKIIEDSVSSVSGVRLTTLQLRYHRFIHDELLTHRLFNRNSSSSRAIPVMRMIDDIERDPAEPIFWGRNQKGMQARREMEAPDIATAKALWREDREHSILMARAMADCGAHKQLVNRLIQNHGHINVVVTATDWKNFLHVRHHPDAQPDMEELARQMRQALSVMDKPPNVLDAGEWHLPYISAAERAAVEVDKLVLVSTARCARTSFLTHEGRSPDLEDDLRLAHDLVLHDPKHASPAEHQATPADSADYQRNLRGWTMHRAMIPNDTVWG
jgi:hypothetical protein